MSATPAWFDELAAFVRIPSISADPAHAGDVRAAAEWVCQFIRGAGGDAEVVTIGDQPLAVGELRATASGVDPGEAPTVLCYGHFDVQPADPLELWESEPFEPEIRDGYLYGRGVGDDKGQLYMLLAGARELATAGELAVNVRFVCDGEEETGGSTILGYLDETLPARPVDVALIFDGGMIAPDVPVFDLATRGVVYCHLDVRTGEADLHSGVFGGVALNAIHVLSSIISSLAAVDGRLAEPLRAGVVAPSADELESWERLPSGAGELAALGARPMDATAARDYYLRTFAEPSLDVHGVQSGSPVLEKTVLPVEAQANVSVRIVPGQDPDVIATVLDELVAAATPAGADVTLTRLSSARPGIVDPEAGAVTLALDAFERALGTRPLLTRSGGTIPLVATLSDLSVPAIITGFTLPDANIHSPNERLLARYVELGIATTRELLREFVSLSPGA